MLPFRLATALILALVLVSCGPEKGPSELQIIQYVERGLQSGFGLESLERKIFAGASEGTGRIEIAAIFVNETALYSISRNREWLMKRLGALKAPRKYVEQLKLPSGTEFKEEHKAGTEYYHEFTLQYRETVNGFEITGLVPFALQGALPKSAIKDQDYLADHPSGEKIVRGFANVLTRMETRDRNLAKVEKQRQTQFNNLIKGASANISGGLLENTSGNSKNRFDCRNTKFVKKPEHFRFTKYEFKCFYIREWSGTNPARIYDPIELTFTFNIDKRDRLIYINKISKGTVYIGSPPLFPRMMWSGNDWRAWKSFATVLKRVN